MVWLDRQCMYSYVCVMVHVLLSFVLVYVQGCNYSWKYCWNAGNFQHCHKKRELYCSVEWHLTCMYNVQYVIVTVVS